MKRTDTDENFSHTEERKEARDAANFLEQPQWRGANAVPFPIRWHEGTSNG
jgi:hypothetical protein